MKKLFIYGFPGLYGGAGTELRHQIEVWLKMGLDLTIIPTMQNYEVEPLYAEMIDKGVKILNANDFSTIKQEDALINFCGGDFLENLDLISAKTSRTIFVNCMTYLFDKERIAHKKNQIAFSIYQRDEVLKAHQNELGSGAKFMKFQPYFDLSEFPYYGDRKNKKVTFGRISRQDSDKFSKDTFHIWEYAVAPTDKRGIVLGWRESVEKKVGKPPHWVETYNDQNRFSVSDFYRSVDILIQSTNTTENLPRVGFEAMASGSVLIVDNRGGWKSMITHGLSGFLCNNAREFIYWASRMSFEGEHRRRIARNARANGLRLGSMEGALASWEKVFTEVYKD